MHNFPHTARVARCARKKSIGIIRLTHWKQTLDITRKTFACSNRFWRHAKIGEVVEMECVLHPSCVNSQGFHNFVNFARYNQYHMWLIACFYLMATYNRESNIIGYVVRSESPANLSSKKTSRCINVRYRVCYRADRRHLAEQGRLLQVD